MTLAARQAAERLLRERTHQLFIERLRAGLRLVLIALGLFALADLGANRAVLALLYPVKLFQLGFVLGVFRILRGAPSWERTVATGLVSIAVFCAVSAVSGLITHDTATTPLLCIVLTMATATLLPWGVRPQLATVTIAAAAVLWNAHAVSGMRVALGNPTVALLVAFVASVHVAREFERYRLERQLAEDGAREGEAFKGAILDAALDCIVAMDEHGRITEFNPVAERTFGYSSADVLGREMATVLVPPGEREAHRAGLARHLQTGAAAMLGRRIETTAMRADGSEFPVELTVARIPGRGRRLFTGHIRDISDRQRVERELTSAKRHAEEEADVAAALLRVAQELDASLDRPDMLERVNRLSVDVLRCDWSSTFLWEERSGAFRLRANVGSPPEVRREVEALEFGWDSLPVMEALRSEDLAEVTGLEHPSPVPPALMMRWQFASSLSVRIRRGDETVGLLVHGYRDRTGPFSARQRRLAIGIARTVAVALENARLIADLHAANRFKTEFVSTMSHELRSPLHVILGFAEMARDPTVGRAERAECLRRIDAAGHDLLALIEEALAAGKLETVRDTIRLQPVSLARFWKEVGEVCRRLPRHPAVRLEWTERVPDVAVLTDPNKLGLVMRNLVGNACKFTQEGRVRADLEATPERLIVRVADTGIGIRREDQDIIFEMFRQADGSDSRRYGGTGLGLYIVRRYVEQLGGSIALDSAPGRGSIFTVTLPCLPVG